MGASSRRRLAFHETLALLGIGDLHPGRQVATDFLLRELDKVVPRRVLEVGAGIGLTTRRLLDRGWHVTAIEPNPVLRRILERRLPLRAYPGTFETFEDAEPYDAVIAESVFYRLDIAQAFARAHRLLRRDGRLALVDMVWTEAANPAAVAGVAANTDEVFGLPAASSERLTWADWRRTLAASGFAEQGAERVVETPPDPRHRRTILLNGVRHPLAFARYLYYRRAADGRGVPDGWLESWMSVWRKT